MWTWLCLTSKLKWFVRSLIGFPSFPLAFVRSLMLSKGLRTVPGQDLKCKRSHYDQNWKEIVYWFYLSHNKLELIVGFFNWRFEKSWGKFWTKSGGRWGLGHGHVCLRVKIVILKKIARKIISYWKCMWIKANLPWNRTYLWPRLSI